MNRRYFLVTTIFTALAATSCILLATASGADVSLVPDANQWSRIEKALPPQATAEPLKPRRILIFNCNVEYDGHRASILAGSEAFNEFGKRTGR